MGKLLEELAPRLETFDDEEEAFLGLQSLAEIDGLRNATYLGANLPTFDRDTTILLTTYAKDWQNRYREQNYYEFDPVLAKGLHSIIPFDWNDPHVQREKFEDFFGEAAEFGVNRQGLSIPIRGPKGDLALFSFNSDLPDHEWADFKSENLSELMMLAYYFHMTAVESVSPGHQIIKLTQRESEVLQWITEGKSYWETGMILSISHKTVDFHLQNIRAKLGTGTNVQAAVKAARLGLLR